MRNLTKTGIVDWHATFLEFEERLAGHQAEISFDGFLESFVFSVALIFDMDDSLLENLAIIFDLFAGS
jgi:hypothetical protein